MTRRPGTSRTSELIATIDTRRGRRRDRAATDDRFIDPVAMEDDPAELFAGDRGRPGRGGAPGAGPAAAAQVPARREEPRRSGACCWRTSTIIESRLHDLFVRLVVDHDRGIAYKQQVRSASSTCRSCCATTRTTGPRRWCWCTCAPSTSARRRPGETSARVDIEEIEQTRADLLRPRRPQPRAPAEGDPRRGAAGWPPRASSTEESEGRYRITPLVEVVLSTDA